MTTSISFGDKTYVILPVVLYLKILCGLQITLIIMYEYETNFSQIKFEDTSAYSQSFDLLKQMFRGVQVSISYVVP